jgi:hypothetical protein
MSTVFCMIICDSPRCSLSFDPGRCLPGSYTPGARLVGMLGSRQRRGGPFSDCGVRRWDVARRSTSRSLGSKASDRCV